MGVYTGEGERIEVWEVEGERIEVWEVEGERIEVWEVEEVKGGSVLERTEVEEVEGGSVLERTEVEEVEGGSVLEVRRVEEVEEGGSVVGSCVLDDPEMQMISISAHTYYGIQITKKKFQVYLYILFFLRVVISFFLLPSFLIVSTLGFFGTVVLSIT